MAVCQLAVQPVLYWSFGSQFQLAYAPPLPGTDISIFAGGTRSVNKTAESQANSYLYQMWISFWLRSLWISYPYSSIHQDDVELCWSILLSSYHFLLKGDRVPWRDDWFYIWGRKSSRTWEPIWRVSSWPNADIKENVGTFLKIEREHLPSLELIFILTPYSKGNVLSHPAFT